MLHQCEKNGKDIPTIILDTDIGSSTGFVTTLANLLNSKADDYSNLSGVELVKAKVKTLYVMGGVFGDAVEPDYNFTQAIDFSLDFFKHWPPKFPEFSPLAKSAMA